ncbi:HK97 family phage prohead protease [Candidatus Poriferisodalis sp.]|uniref:HK97 family phage prohead protease n=1 Tax=Candidatus Poriferisodalis sp. TaxID=3101277 RepID=UPI003B017713
MSADPDGAGDGPPIEHTDALEVRAEGRTLTGYAVRYGDIGRNPRTGKPERFERGAFTAADMSEPLQLRAHHRGEAVAVPLPIEFRDDGLHISHDLDDRTARRVAAGEFGGLSVGFYALEEKDDAGVRVIARARLDHVALARRPAYPGSTLELRNEADTDDLWRLL